VLPDLRELETRSLDGVSPARAVLEPFWCGVQERYSRAPEIV